MPRHAMQIGTRLHRVLLRRVQVLDELAVDDDQLEELIEASQLTEVSIRGHRRFDSHEVDDLVGRSICKRP